MPSRWQASLRGCENHAPVGNALYASAPDQYEADYRHLCELCTFFHVTPPAHGSTFFSTDLGGACRLRWERHTEAQTYTFTKAANEADRERPFGEASVAISLIPKAWLASLPGLVLSAVHVAMLPSSSQTARYELASIGQHFHLDEEALVRAATVDRGRFRVYSDWRTHSDGFGRVIVHGMPLDETPNKRTAAGKVLQRVVELDKYRALALLALPFGYLAKGASALGWLPVPLEVALAMSVPVLGSVAYMGLHRLKAGVMKAHR